MTEYWATKRAEELWLEWDKRQLVNPGKSAGDELVRRLAEEIMRISKIHTT